MMRTILLIIGMTLFVTSACIGKDDLKTITFFDANSPVCKTLGDSSGKKKKEQVGVTRVYKYDGSVQCEGPGISLEVMAQELIGAGIDVIAAYKSHDGLLRPAVCGAGTGKINVYLIPRANLPDARDLGFNPVKCINPTFHTP